MTTRAASLLRILEGSSVHLALVGELHEEAARGRCAGGAAIPVRYGGRTVPRRRWRHSKVYESFRRARWDVCDVLRGKRWADVGSRSDVRKTFRPKADQKIGHASDSRQRVHELETCCSSHHGAYSRVLAAMSWQGGGRAQCTAEICTRRELPTSTCRASPITPQSRP